MIAFYKNCMANIILSVCDLLQHIERSSAAALSGSQAQTFSIGFLYMKSESWHQGILALTADKANIYPCFLQVWSGTRSWVWLAMAPTDWCTLPPTSKQESAWPSKPWRENTTRGTRWGFKIIWVRFESRFLIFIFLTSQGSHTENIATSLLGQYRNGRQ